MLMCQAFNSTQPYGDRRIEVVKPLFKRLLEDEAKMVDLQGLNASEYMLKALLEHDLEWYLQEADYLTQLLKIELDCNKLSENAIKVLKRLET